MPRGRTTPGELDDKVPADRSAKVSRGATTPGKLVDEVPADGSARVPRGATTPGLLEDEVPAAGSPGGKYIPPVTLRLLSSSTMDGGPFLPGVDIVDVDRVSYHVYIKWDKSDISNQTSLHRA